MLIQYYATGGGAVFWVGWSVYNRVLKKIDRPLLRGLRGGRQIEYMVVGSSGSF